MTSTDFAPETIELAATMMTGQLRDLVLDHMKDAKQTLPWNLLSEDVQKQVISTVEQSVRNAVRQAVEIIARDGKRAVLCQVDQMLVKDGLKLVLVAPRSDTNVMALTGVVKKTVLLTLTDDDAYSGAQERKPDPLQNEMFPDGEDGDEGPVFDGTPSGRDD